MIATPSHNIVLKPVRAAIKGLWKSDTVLLEAVPMGWECQVPVRRIGKSNYFEFRPVIMGGRFLIIGTYRTKDACCTIAARLKAGTHVVRGSHTDSIGQTPITVVEWSEASAEIAGTA